MLTDQLFLISIVVLTVVVLLVLYVLFAFLRISRLKNEALRAQDLSTHAAQSAAAKWLMRGRLLLQAVPLQMRCNVNLFRKAT